MVKLDLLQPRPINGALQENGNNRDTENLRRPADVYLPRWKRGIPAALDFAVTSGLRRNMVEKSAVDGKSATTSYEDFKRSHLDTEAKCQEEGIQFIPMICEADGGGWGKAAHQVWSELAKRKAIIAGEQSSITAVRLLQSLGIILHRENALSILRRLPRSPGRDYTELLAASVVCNSAMDL